MTYEFFEKSGNNINQNNVENDDLISVDGEFCPSTGFPIEVSILNERIKLANLNDLKKEQLLI